MTKSKGIGTGQYDRPLTQLQLGILASLIAFGDEWISPSAIGGSSRSNHTGILRTLTKRGLVERERKSTKYEFRPHYRYRLSDEGRKVAACIYADYSDGQSPTYYIGNEEEG